LNGLTNANHILGKEIFNIDDWKIIGEYVHDIDGGRHQAFYSAKRDIKCLGVSIEEGERVQVEQSLKYSEEESQVLWELAGLKEIGKWTASGESYSKSRIYFSEPQEAQSASLPYLRQRYGFLSEKYEMTAKLFMNILVAGIVSPPADFGLLVISFYTPNCKGGNPSNNFC
jgi:hypothetical protein